HAMDEGADTGPILAQRPIALPDGIGYDAAEATCAQLCAELLLETVADLAAGTATPRPQSPGTWPLAPSPRDADHLITATWSARRAFNFIRGVGARYHSIRFHLDGAEVPIVEAISYSPEAALSTPTRREGDHLLLRCSPGVLTVPA